MAQHDSLVSLFQDIANAIRAKIGGSATIVADDFPDQIATVYTAGQTSAKVGTASAADVRSGKTFTNSSTIGGTGSLADSTTGTSSTGTLVATKTPGASVQYVNVSAGYTAARYWAISAVSTETKTITPSTAVQTATPASGKYLSSVTVNAISTQTKTTTAGTAVSTVNADSGKYMTAVTVSPTPSETQTATPGTAVQTITPTSGKLLSSVTVSAISTQTKTTTAGTAVSTVNADSGKYMTAVTVNPTPSETKTATSSTAAQTITPTSGKLMSSVTISAISTETKSVTATTAVQTVSPTSGKVLTSVTVNPQAHSSTYNLKQVTANTKIDLTATHNYRYIAFYGYDYNLANLTSGGSSQIKFTCPWNGTGANFYYGYFKVPAKFYLRCFMFHGINNRMHGYMDANASTWHTRVDDSTWGFQLKNTATAQTTWNATNYGWYRGTYNGSKLYPNSTVYVASNVASPVIKGFYGGFYVA